MPDVKLFRNKRIVLFLGWIILDNSAKKGHIGFAIWVVRVLFFPN